MAAKPTAFLAVAGVVLGPYFFFRGFRLLQLKRRVMNVPTSSIRAAALGPVEVSGKAIGPYTLVVPLSQSDCRYYRLVVESNPRGDPGKRVNEMCAPLFLDDGTGIVMVYPKGSELRFETFLPAGRVRQAGDGTDEQVSIRNAGVLSGVQH